MPTSSVVAVTRRLRRLPRSAPRWRTPDRRLAMLHFRRAQRTLDGGQVNHGLLWLVECWRYAAKADDRAWQNLARANLTFWRYNCPEIKGVFSDNTRVRTVAFSPDGKTILTTCEVHAARLWDANSCLPIGERMPHTSELSLTAEFSHDGKLVLTASDDKTARLWDATSGRPIGQPLKHQSRVRCAAFGPDDKAVLTGAEDGMARLWDASTGQPLDKVIEHHLMVNSVAFSPNGKSILTMSGSTARELWDVKNVAACRHLPAAKFAHRSACTFGPDSRRSISKH